MSCIRLNLTDRERTISGEVHGSIGDAVVAALSAQPETTHELELALARFQKRTDDSSALRWLRDGENLEPYDAGIVIVDLAAQVVMIDSTYSVPAWLDDCHFVEEPEFGAVESCFRDAAQPLASNGGAGENGEHQSVSDQDEPRTFEVGYHDGEKLTAVRLPYRIPETWRFVGSVPEYEGICQDRRATRAARTIYEWFDARAVLFGRPLCEFLASEIINATNLEAEGLFAQIHSRWLTTARHDLQGRTPRRWLLAQKDFIDFDLHSRELQWSFTGECPPPLLTTTHAYRFGGFGTHEIVLYYDLIRLLLEESYRRVRQGTHIVIDEETERLEQIKNAWLEAPDPDNHGKSPALIMEWERRRIPLALTPQQSIIDEDCPICQAAAADLESPMFWHLDGCNMDDQFEFSFSRTRKEWEADRRRMEEFNREFDRRWKAQETQAGAGSASFMIDQEPF